MDKNSSLAERFTHLMANVPPAPTETNLAKIGLRHRKAQAEFDAHALKVREVIMEWLAKPEGERESGFLRELNQHWDIPNDSKLRHYFDLHSDESRKLEAIIADYRYQLSLVERLVWLMSNVPVIPSDFNLGLIGRKHRKWDLVVTVLIVVAICVVTDQYFEVGFPYYLSMFLLLGTVYFYMFSKKVDMWWGRRYMPRVQADFDAHALKVREVIDEWLAQAEGERESGFLYILSKRPTIFGNLYGLPYETKKKLIELGIPQPVMVNLTSYR